ncbi:hypothetical protein MKW94_006891 [Papaver nudicaule]|uniref:S-protein homolog n=1 Tax=Papaver nudicaule TaxID=74823 RepID=A0AA41RQ57_PAPNU|nr:hypothetical protein [Papaver nudicaule]
MSDYSKSRVSSSSSNHAYVLGLLVMALLVCECSAYGAFWNAIHASVKNDISDKTVLTIHCKSKEDDLGEHRLAYGESFAWNFHQNFMRSTMFWCFMWWRDSTGKYIQGSYEVYKLKRDWHNCHTQCPVSIRKDGIYAYYDELKKFDLLFPWQKKQ